MLLSLPPTVANLGFRPVPFAMLPLEPHLYRPENTRAATNMLSRRLMPFRSEHPWHYMPLDWPT